MSRLRGPPVNRKSALHLHEQMRERRADLQNLLAMLELNFQATTQVATDGRNGVDIDQSAAVYLEKYIRIQLVDQLLDRLVDQCLGGGGDDERVIVVRLEIANLIDGDEPHGPA